MSNAGETGGDKVRSLSLPSPDLATPNHTRIKACGEGKRCGLLSAGQIYVTVCISQWPRRVLEPATALGAKFMKQVRRSCCL